MGTDHTVLSPATRATRCALVLLLLSLAMTAGFVLLHSDGVSSISKVDSTTRIIKPASRMLASAPVADDPAAMKRVSEANTSLSVASVLTSVMLEHAADK